MMERVIHFHLMGEEIRAIALRQTDNVISRLRGNSGTRGHEKK